MKLGNKPTMTEQIVGVIDGSFAVQVLQPAYGYNVPGHDPNPTRWPPIGSGVAAAKGKRYSDNRSSSKDLSHAEMMP